MQKGLLSYLPTSGKSQSRTIVMMVQKNCKPPFPTKVGSRRVLPFWLLVASWVRGAAMAIMQCPD